MSFGVGEKAEYRFDEVRFFARSVEQSTMGRSPGDSQWKSGHNHFL